MHAIIFSPNLVIARALATDLELDGVTAEIVWSRFVLEERLQRPAFDVLIVDLDNADPRDVLPILSETPLSAGLILILNHSCTCDIDFGALNRNRVIVPTRLLPYAVDGLRRANDHAAAQMLAEVAARPDDTNAQTTIDATIEGLH